MRPPIRRLGTIAVAGGCSLVLVACGGSAGKPDNGGVRASQGIAFADCMRSHGVPNFPDPGSGGGIQIGAGSGIDPASPAFQSAQKSCSRLLPGGGPRGEEVSESQKLAMLALAQCMRKHGFTSFPDPTTTPPSPGAGFGMAFGGPGSFIAVPQAMTQSPGFQGAAAACGFPGAGGRHGKKGSPAAP
jgi:hypothetical protein